MRSWSATYPARGTSASAASDGEPASHARPINVGSRDFLNITTPCREWRGSRDESCRVAHAPLPADPLQSVCHPAGTKPAGTRSSRRCRRPRNRGTRDVALLDPLDRARSHPRRRAAHLAVQRELGVCADEHRRHRGRPPAAGAGDREDLAMRKKLPAAAVSSWRRIAALFTLVLAVGCASVQTTESGTVGVDRRQTMSALVSEEDINQGAAQAYAQVLDEARRKGALDRDPAEVQRARTIAARLIPQTGVFRPDARAWKWDTHVITSNEVNAWCMPGGKIAVYSALIEKLRLTDDELAAVMGHEIAHALREHGRERASRAVNQSIALGVIGAAAGVGQGTMDLAQLALEVTLNLPNSREQEVEADRIGVELAARAGYNPRAAVTLWQKMEQASQGGPPAWLSTHPSREARQRDLEVYAEKVMPLYAQARR